MGLQKAIFEEMIGECVKAKDMAAERARIDSRLASLRSDVEMLNKFTLLLLSLTVFFTF